jgi:hypothetical protein
MGTNNKQKHEKVLALEFLQLYATSVSLSPTYTRLGNPNENEPDIICSDGYTIEIVSSYDNKSQAKQYWEQMKDIKNPFQNKELSLHTVEELQSTVCKKLNKLKNDAYSGTDESKIILLCYCASPFFDYKTAEELRLQYMPFRPDNSFKKYFVETWIIWWEGGDSYGILKLE